MEREGFFTTALANILGGGIRALGYAKNNFLAPAARASKPFVDKAARAATNPQTYRDLARQVDPRQLKQLRSNHLRWLDPRSARGRFAQTTAAANALERLGIDPLLIDPVEGFLATTGNPGHKLLGAGLTTGATVLQNAGIDKVFENPAFGQAYNFVEDRVNDAGQFIHDVYNPEYPKAAEMPTYDPDSTGLYMDKEGNLQLGDRDAIRQGVEMRRQEIQRSDNLKAAEEARAAQVEQQRLLDEARRQRDNARFFSR